MIQLGLAPQTNESSDEQTPNKRLFVISPIGSSNEDVHKHANQVLELIRDAVGDDFQIKRADDYHKEKRMIDTMLKAIATDHVVVAYLGKKPWNPNVMLEIGCRLSTHRPLVMLVEEGSDLPFDLQDFRCIKIPKAEDLEKMAHKDHSSLREAIRSKILDESTPLVVSPYAVAEIVMDTDPSLSEEEKANNSFFTMASQAAEDFFHAPGNLVGRSISDVLVGILPFLEESQLQVLSDEQDKIIGSLLQGRVKGTTATVPFIFKKEHEEIDPTFRGKAYLPLILNFESQKNTLMLRMLYSEVPEQLVDSNGAHFVVSQ